MLYEGLAPAVGDVARGGELVGRHVHRVGSRVVELHRADVAGGLLVQPQVEPIERAALGGVDAYVEQYVVRAVEQYGRLRGACRDADARCLRMAGGRQDYDGRGDESLCERVHGVGVDLFANIG